MRVLGIETSCDETSAAVLEGAGDDARIRSLVILSQDVHRIFGGVVPEIASRAHLTAIVPVVEQALADSGMGSNDVDAVAVTNAPGLVGALLVGVAFGKAFAFARRVPVIGVHHMEGHLFATALENAAAVPPFTALLVSGGHTLLIDVEAWGRYRLLGRTRDDAAGEAFDKVAKLLGLPYPGGPHVERIAALATTSRANDGGGTGGALRFARPMLRRDQRPGDAEYYDVSFSGLKTAVLNAVKSSPPASEAERAPIARAFQDAVVDTLVQKTARAATAYGRRRVVLGGGVACNGALVAAMRERFARDGVDVFAPTPRLATDNAAMIARAGLFHLERGERSGLDLNAFAASPIPGLVAA
ncbi:MAG TPA: tRNA (adenosine(37)-N6)-threonylcarbamoyltransferase complex transferase subunit TsaD [Gemmatimonadaceae bacterium]|jgi:N6-L-threonylcarbamoyladenine synthase|nr:tRNA (adenosine(37)-N6)-threonylcarbamoyltransferase complex transferase subunit TsaD [Gemmatimonadaceae bacterium]